MLKGHFSRSIRWLGAVVFVSAAAWAGCDHWNGIGMSESNLVSPNGAITQGADEQRTNWYPDQPGLDPSIVGGPNFKRLFKTALPSAGEPVLAQPLVVNGKVLIVTEENNVYLLDAATGAITATRSLGAAFNASGVLGCGDISPHVGITGTPVIDTSSNTAYFFSKSAAPVYTLHAVDAGTLAEKAGFPVTISGTAQNDATKTFDATYAHQRPGLLLMGGVVYGAFASHCDHTPYEGWIIGVTTAGVIKTRFSTSAGTGSGDGIWMSGSGLMSDGAGNILFATGNPQGATPSWPATGGIASNAPPANLDESTARVVLQADGSLKTTDFFAPYNAQNMGDNDLAGGGVIGLPSQFGTTSVPRTAAIVGKAGLFYLLNRDVLGGYQKGPGNGDAVLTQINLNGGTWGHPAVWPGDGGYIAVTTNGGANDQTGYRLQLLKYAVNGANPSMTVVGYATSSTGVVNSAGGPPIDNFGAGAGSPTVTSNNTTAGSAVFWAVGGGSLRAYKVANNMLTSIFADNFGAGAKYQTVGVGSGRVYVGTGDGNVIGWGSGTVAVSGPAVAFGNVTVGQQSTLTATITANQNLTIPAGGLTVSPSTYTFGTSTPALPATLTAGQSITVPVTFKPTAAGLVSGALNVSIAGGGGGSISLSGTGQVNAAQLTITPATVAFGGIVTGSTKQISVLLQNTGNQTLTFATSTLPAAPFSVTGVPANGATLAAGANVTATVTFAPTAAGTFAANLVVNSNGGNVTILISGAFGDGAPHGGNAAVDRLRHDELGRLGHEDLHDLEHGRHRSPDREVEAARARPVRRDDVAPRGLGPSGGPDPHGVGDVLVDDGRHVQRRVGHHGQRQRDGDERRLRGRRFGAAFAHGLGRERVDLERRRGGQRAGRQPDDAVVDGRRHGGGHVVPGRHGRGADGEPGPDGLGERRLRAHVLGVRHERSEQPRRRGRDERNRHGDPGRRIVSRRDGPLHPRRARHDSGGHDGLVVDPGAQRLRHGRRQHRRRWCRWRRGCGWCGWQRRARVAAAGAAGSGGGVLSRAPVGRRERLEHRRRGRAGERPGRQPRVAVVYVAPS